MTTGSSLNWTENVAMIEYDEDKDRPTSLDLVQATWITVTSLLIFTIGMFGNITTIYIFTRSKKLRHNKVFELILAALDIFALVVPLPFFTVFLIFNDNPGYFLPLIVTLAAHSYYLTILCSTICRYVAVYHPFKYNQFFENWRPRFVAFIAITFVCFLARALAKIFLDLGSIFLVIIFLNIASFVAIAVLFVKITLKLMKLNTVAPQTVQMSVAGRRACQSQNNLITSQIQTHKKHVVAVKTFLTIWLCLLVSYLPGYFVTLGLLRREAIFLYFINHLCNPLIYFMFNNEFRKSVRKIFM